MYGTIIRCPTCGDDQIEQVCRDWTSTCQGQSYVVQALKFYECPVCGERVFERDAVAKIRVYSPAYVRKPAKAQTAKADQSEASTQVASAV
jgi:YgiT-type zinc finger domain-containing protein